MDPLAGADSPDGGLTPAAFASVDAAFGVSGQSMRAHAGRSVVRVTVDGRVHYLKRYWLNPRQFFQRHVARGRHELRMIDWLNEVGGAGPRVVARGLGRRLGLGTRLFFLMEEVAGERSLEQAWWESPADGERLLLHLATFAASLHDRGFVHTDFSERHIFVGPGPGTGFTFRLIDVERARLGPPDDRRAAADLKTLAASIADQHLRRRIETDFLDTYARLRQTLSPGADFRGLFAKAVPTRTF